MTTRKSIILNQGFFQELNTPTDDLDFAGNTTSDLTEGTNLYYTNARARGAISVTDSGGDGSLAYNSSTGVITYTGPSAANVRAHLSVAAGSGLTYNSGTGVFSTSAIPNAQLDNSSLTVGSTSISLGATATTVVGLTSLTSTTLEGTTTVRIGAADAANGIVLNSSGITFEGSGADANETTISVTNATADRSIVFPDAGGTVALLTSLSASNSGTGHGALAYNNSTGAFTYTVVTAANIRGEISVTDSGGDGSLAYNNSTGVITYTGPSAANVRAHLSVAAGSGLTYNSGTGVFGTSAIPNAQLANSSFTLGSTGIALGATATTITGLTSLTSTAVITNDGVSGFAIRDADDLSKIARFDSGTISASTTRTYTFPDVTGQLLVSGGAATFVDSTFRIEDNADNTKELAFECSSITSGQTRTMTVPDTSGTISTESFATAIAVALG